MNPDTPARQLMNLIWPGALATQAIRVVATLGIADLIDDEPRPIADLAKAAECDRDALTRVLRALASLGVFAESNDELIEHTPLSRALRNDEPDSVRIWGMFLGSDSIWRPWGELLHTVSTGEDGFSKIFETYFDRYMAAHPDDAEIYNRAMSVGTAMFVDSYIEAYDFSPFTRIVDIGGGRGGLLAAILKANESARGILFDLPAVVEEATELRDADLADRCELVGGDFFNDVLPQGDLLILKAILHGFAEDDARRILQACRRAISTDGRLLVIESLPRGAHEPSPQKAFMDLFMLSIGGGRERSEEAMRALLRQGGFRVTRIVPTTSSNFIVEAAPI